MFNQSMDDVFAWKDGSWIYRYEYYELPEFKGEDHMNFIVIFKEDKESYKAFWNEVKLK